MKLIDERKARGLVEVLEKPMTVCCGFDLRARSLQAGIVFDSDYPYENFNVSVKFVESFDLTEEEPYALWCGNVEKFGLV